jgi:peptidoglycan/xylan/chitin deacetylase (PgdA/CDA1 family)
MELMSVIINFHDVDDSVWLENTIFFLKSKYNLVSYDEVNGLNIDGSDRRKVGHITVDDGDRTFYNVIFPILKKHKIPATIFMSPDIVVNQLNFWFQEVAGYDYQKLSGICSDVLKINSRYLQKYHVFHIMKCLKIDVIWDIIRSYQKKYKPDHKPCQNMGLREMNEVQKSGLINIGAHTLRHPILANEEAEVAEKEIVASFNGLAEITGHEITCFAYPNGEPGLDFTQREMSILSRAGCRYAFATQAGILGPGTDPFAIPRFGISEGDSVQYLKLKLMTGKQWNTIMRLKPGNEFTNRKALLQLLSN